MSIMTYSELNDKYELFREDMKRVIWEQRGDKKITFYVNSTTGESSESYIHESSQESVYSLPDELYEISMLKEKMGIFECFTYYEIEFANKKSPEGKGGITIKKGGKVL